MVNLMMKPEKYDYRRSALRILLIVTIFAAGVFVINNVRVGLHVFAFVEATVGLLWCWILSQVSTTKHLQRLSLIYLLTFYFIVLYGIFIASFKSGLFSWLFIFPILSYLLLGRRVGTILTAISVSIGFAILGRLVWLMDPEVSWIVMGNFGFAIAAIWSMVYVYESKREAVVEHLKEQVTRDPLTGLLNVRNLNDILTSVLSAAQRHSEPVTIAYIDINDFKQINDCQGHQKGNEILISVAQMIQKITRVEDYSFRYGGDEFCIVFSNCTETQVKNTYGQRLSEEVHHHLNKLTMSIGYAQTGPTNYLSAENLIDKADKNMYSVKYSTKNNEQSDNDNVQLTKGKSMSYTLIHNEKASQYEYHIDGNIAYITYDEQNGNMHLTHTIVPEILAGKGLAKTLLEAVLEQIEKDNKKAVAQCSYIVKYLEKHPTASHYFA
jgi:diguanylate cyclase (GGDEF)-like protein